MIEVFTLQIFKFLRIVSMETDNSVVHLPSELHLLAGAAPKASDVHGGTSHMRCLPTVLEGLLRLSDTVRKPFGSGVQV